MKKLLPINTDPYIRQYTHHSYIHSIICTPDKVLKDLSEKIACVSIKDYPLYDWDSEIEDIKYEMNDDTFAFYGNKWNTNMNAAFFRKCSDDDEIEITVSKQLYSGVWASICVFLTDDNEDTMTDFDTSYKFVFGNFSKDGVFIRAEKREHEIVCNEITFPLTIKLTRKGSQIILFYKDAKSSQETITLDMDDLALDDLKNNCSRIGVGVNLRNNSYYEWVFSNYINIMVKEKDLMPIDYLSAIRKNWDYHTFNYFINYHAETEQSILKFGFPFVDYVKMMIDAGRYVEMLTNDYIHLDISEETFFHPDLIYGYDDENRCFHLLYVYDGITYDTTMSYDDFLSERNHFDDRDVYVYEYNPGYEQYTLSPQHLLQIFREYRDSQNISHYESQHDEGCHYGLNGIEYLLSDPGIDMILADIRISHLLYERSVCNNDRIEYLYNKKILSEKEFNSLKEISTKICDCTKRIRNLVVKQKISGMVYREKIVKYAQDYAESDRLFTDLIISALEKYQDL